MKKFFSPPFLQVSNLKKLIFHKSITPRMQTENLRNNSPKQIYVILNTNQIKLKTNPEFLNKNNLNQKGYY